MIEPVNAPSQIFAAHVMAQLAAAGVSQVFVAPGSRSQALAIAAHQLAAAGKINLHVKLDERSLAFQALGAARATNQPVAVITTSGTAVANLYPAVLEAFHTSTPLLLITADRPHSLRNTGANQTTLQNNIFGEFVLKSFDIDAFDANSGFDLASFARDLANDAVSIALGHGRHHGGAVQLNLSFAEPLSSTQPNAAEIQKLLPAPMVKPKLASASVDVSLNTLVIAGDNAGAPAEFDVTGLPVFAEPTSGLVGADSSVVGYQQLLIEQPQLLEGLEQLVILGKPTLSRAVLKLLKRDGLKVFALGGRHRNVKPTEVTVEVDRLERAGEPSLSWLEQWQSASAKPAADSINSLLNSKFLAEQLAEIAREQDRLVLGASTVIRDFDVAGQKIEGQVFANRGLAGIDGTIGFATGIALSDPTSRVRLVLGDLTALHDAGSLAYLDSDPQLDLQVIVVNDHGGSIFERLEVRGQLDEPTFEQLFKTPQQVDFAKLAAAYRWQYLLVENTAQVAAALQTRGRVLIEVRPNA